MHVIAESSLYDVFTLKSDVTMMVAVSAVVLLYYI